MMGTALAPWISWNGGPTLRVLHRGNHVLVDVTPPASAWAQLWSLLEEGGFWTWSDVSGDPRQKDGWRSSIEIRWQGRGHAVQVRLAGSTPDVLRVEACMRKILSWMDTLAGFVPERWDEEGADSAPDSAPAA
jgi:hypothetical protein